MVIWAKKTFQMLFVVSGEGDVDPNQATFTTPGLPATAHASHALSDIAKKEPEILDPVEIRGELARLRVLGDKKSVSVMKKILDRVKRVRRIEGYKYGL